MQIRTEALKLFENNTRFDFENNNIFQLKEIVLEFKAKCKQYPELKLIENPILWDSTQLGIVGFQQFEKIIGILDSMSQSEDTDRDFYKEIYSLDLLNCLIVFDMLERKIKSKSQKELYEK